MSSLARISPAEMSERPFGRRPSGRAGSVFLLIGGIRCRASKIGFRSRIAEIRYQGTGIRCLNRPSRGTLPTRFPSPLGGERDQVRSAFWLGLVDERGLLGELDQGFDWVARVLQLAERFGRRPARGPVEHLDGMDEGG